MIPKPLLKRLLADKRNETCIACGKYGTELNHVWTNMGSKQINEVWAILGVCDKCHRGNNGTMKKGVKEKCEAESIKRLIESGFENLNLYQKPMDSTWENRVVYYTRYYKK